MTGNWRLLRWLLFRRSSAEWWRSVRRRGLRGWRRTAASWRLEERWPDHQRSSHQWRIGHRTLRSSAMTGWSASWDKTGWWCSQSTSSERSRRGCCRCRCWVGWWQNWRNWVETASWNTTRHCRRSTVNCPPGRRCLPLPSHTSSPLPTHQSSTSLDD